MLQVEGLREKLWEHIVNVGFVQEISAEDVFITEKFNQKQGGLQSVRIIDIPNSVYTIHKNWFLNQLEDNLVLGFYPQQTKSVDGILLIWQENHVCVYLIELKSQIADKELESLIEKIESSLNRFIFLLSVYTNISAAEKQQINIYFEGIVFYTQTEKNIRKKARKANYDKVYEIFHDKTQFGTILCQTVFKKEKIPIKFVRYDSDKTEKTSTKENIEITYENIKRNN